VVSPQLWKNGSSRIFMSSTEQIIKSVLSISLVDSLNEEQAPNQHPTRMHYDAAMKEVFVSVCMPNFLIIL